MNLEYILFQQVLMKNLTLLCAFFNIKICYISINC